MCVRASLFCVFHSSALVGLSSPAVCPIRRGRRERENSDWMLSLANKSVPENSESDENEHVNEGSTDRRRFKYYILIRECFHSMSRLK